MEKREKFLLICAIALVAFVTVSLAVTYEPPSNDPCNRLDPCCYGGKPDYIYHPESTGYTFKYWEKVDRNDTTLPTLFELWHYNANDTSLFYDNTTKHTVTAQSLDHLRYTAIEEADAKVVDQHQFEILKAEESEDWDKNLKK